MTQDPCIHDRALEAMLAGQADAKSLRRATSHLEGCEDCRERLAESELVGAAIREALCPSDEELALWVEGQLPLPRARRVREHLTVCAACEELSEIVGAAMDAEASARRSRGRSRSASSRRSQGRRNATRRAVTLQRRGAPAWLTIGLPAAAAAALLLAFVVASGPASDPQNPIAGRDPKPPRVTTPTPRPDPSETPTRDPNATDPATQTPGEPKPTTPDEPGRPDPITTPEPSEPVRPDPVRPVEPPPVEPKPPVREPGTGSETTAEPAPVKPEVATGLAVSEADGGLAVRRGGRWERLEGMAVLTSTDELAARGGHGSFVFSEVEVLLREGSVIQLEALDAGESRESRLSIKSGEACFALRGRGGRGPFVARVGESRVAAVGTRFVVREDGGLAQVYVREGQVSFSTPAGTAALREGEAMRGGAGQGPKTVPAPGEDEMLWISDAVGDRFERRSISYPVGFLALRAIEELLPQLEGESVAGRAQALRALRAARLSPRLQHILPSELDAKLDRAEAGLAAMSADELVSAGGGADVVLAGVLEAWLKVNGRKSSLSSYDRKFPAEHARLSERVLALCASLTTGKALTPKAVAALRSAALLDIDVDDATWEAIAARLGGEGELSTEEAVMILWLPRKAQRAKELKGRLKEVAARVPAMLADEAVAPEHRQALTLLSGGAPDLEALLPALVSEAAPGSAARLWVLTGGWEAVLTGPARKAPELKGPRILRRGEGYLVEFSYRPETSQPKAFLCGSWDSWDESATEMHRDSDGVFRIRIRLSPRRHEYKFRNGDADANWVCDPSHPLIVDNGHGGKNSLLDLR